MTVVALMLAIVAFLMAALLHGGIAANPAGLKGDKGDPGVDGERGLTGADGPQGIAGPEGPSASFNYATFKLAVLTTTQGDIKWGAAAVTFSTVHPLAYDNTTGIFTVNTGFAGPYLVCCTAVMHDGADENECTIRFNGAAELASATSSINHSEGTETYASATISQIIDLAEGVNYTFEWDSLQEGTADLFTSTHGTMIQIPS